MALAASGGPFDAASTGELCFRGRRLEVVAGGAAAAIGVLMKQSGLDAALTFGFVVGVLALRRRLRFVQLSDFSDCSAPVCLVRSV